MMRAVAEFVWKSVWMVIIMPFIIPAFLIVKLLGGEPFSMDDMGIGFMSMVVIAIGIAVGAGMFFLGTLVA